MVSKRLEEARQAFKRGDVKALVAAHDPGRIAHAAQEAHDGTSHQYIGDTVYGGLAAGVAYGIRALLKGLGG